MRFEHKKSDFVCVQTSSYRMFTRKTDIKHIYVVENRVMHLNLCLEVCMRFQSRLYSCRSFLVVITVAIKLATKMQKNWKRKKNYWYQATENNVYSHAQGITVSKRIQILLLFFPIAIPQFHIINKLYSIYCMQFKLLILGIFNIITIPKISYYDKNFRRY